MYPQIFGKEHLIYLAISFLVASCAFFYSRKYVKTEQARDIMFKSAAAILFLIIFINRLVLVFVNDTVSWEKLIPDSFCSASSYVLSLSLLFGKRNNIVLHFVWLIALVGGTIATFYPNFIADYPSFMHPSTLLGIMHHTWAAIIVVLMLMHGHLELTYKKWYCTPIGFSAYLSLGAFLICVLGYENPFYMTDTALPGTPLTVWVIAPIYISVYALILLSVELIKNKKKAHKNER